MRKRQSFLGLSRMTDYLKEQVVVHKAFTSIKTVNFSYVRSDSDAAYLMP